MSSLTSFVLCGASAAALLAAGPIANADTVDNPASWTVDQVTVTAPAGYTAPIAGASTRTATPIIETPQSIQVLTRTLLDEQDLRTLSDALVNVSGVTPSKPEEAVLINPIIRGFQAETYIDGLPAYGGTPIADPSSLVNVERIEVAKGPSSALYGGGLGAPLGGLINLVSKAPTGQRAAEVGLRAGSFNTLDPYFDVNQPLTADHRLLFRVTGEYQSADSPIHAVNSERWSIYPTLSFALTDKTVITVRGQYGHVDQLEYSGLPAAVTVPGTQRALADHFSGATDAPHTTIENKLVTVELAHAFSEALKGEVAARYYESRFDEYGSFIYPAFYPPSPTAPTAYALLTGYLPTTTKETTLDGHLEYRTSLMGAAHDLLVGVNLDHTQYDAAIGFNFVPIGIVDYANPNSDVPFGTAPKPTSTETDTYETSAIYLQDQATIAGRLHLTGSVRYTQLTLRQRELALDKTYSRTTPRIGATFDVSPSVAVFAGYSEGFRAVPNFYGTSPPKPETSTSVEAGVKFAVTSLGLSGTVAGYQLTRQNVAVANPSVPFTSIQTGEQQSKGYEADLIWEPSRNLSVLAAYANTDARVTRDTTLPVGSQLIRSPRNSGRLAVRYRVLDGALKGLSFGGGVTAASRRQVTLPNLYQTPAYAVLDAQAAYSWDRYTVSASVSNLADRSYFEPYAYLAQSVVIPGQSRAAYVTLKARF